MKAEEMRKMMDSLFNELDDLENSESAQKTLQFVKKIAEYEASRGAEGDSVIAELLDNNLWLDCEDQRKYMSSLMGEEFEVDIENAKRLWIIKELEFLIEEFKD